MTDDRESLRAAFCRPGDARLGQVVNLLNAMRAATAPLAEQFSDPREAMSVLMSAGAFFAGIQAGTLMLDGSYHPRDRKRLSEAMLVNFRKGTDYGLRRAAEIEARTIGGRG